MPFLSKTKIALDNKIKNYSNTRSFFLGGGRAGVGAGPGADVRAGVGAD